MEGNMKRLSKSKKMSTLLGAGLLMLTACAPDSLTRGGAAQPALIERSTDDGTATSVNEAANINAASNAAANANEASNANEANVQAAPGVSAPTLQPRPQGEIEFTGTVEVIASDMWVVGGRTVAVTAATEIKPGLAVGTLAKVHAMPQADGALWAREIEPASGNENDNGNTNDNGNDNSNNNGNANSNDDHGNGNGNDDHGGNVNSNDDNGNDDHGGNNNANDDNGNDDHSGNGNDDHGGNGNDNHGGNSNDD
jgi:hypothetical protein